MKKNCNIIKDLLPLYVDNVCSNDTRTLVESHLKECENCQKELKNIKSVINTDLLEKENFLDFKKFMNYKIWKNTIFIILIIVILAIPCLYFYGNYEFKLQYNDNMKIEKFENKNNWNFAFYTTPCGTSNTKTINYKNTNYIFLTRKYTLQDYFDNYYCTTPLDIDYNSINPNDNMEVYYTNVDLENVKDTNLSEVINNSKLIFTNELDTKTMSCTLDNKNYEYTLSYYKVSEQIIESIGDSELPNELLNEIYTQSKSYRRLWINETASDAIKKLDNYITNNGGYCTFN